jgi:predicted dehydrogenase
MPADPPEVTAWAHQFRDLGAEGFYDELRVMIRCGRVTANAVFSGSAKPLAHRLTVYGTRNILEVDHISRTAVLLEAPRIPSAVGRLLPAFCQARNYLRAGLENARAFWKSDFHYFAGMNRLISAFYASILDGTPPPIPYGELLWVYSVIDEVFAQVAAQSERSLACAR